MESAAKLHTGLETGEDGFLCDLVGQITSRGVFHGEDPLDFSLPLLLLQLSLISIVTRVFQLILKPLGQPVIVSQILVSFHSLILILNCLFFYEHFCFSCFRFVSVSTCLNLARKENEEFYLLFLCFVSV